MKSRGEACLARFKIQDVGAIRELVWETTSCTPPVVARLKIQEVEAKNFSPVIGIRRCVGARHASPVIAVKCDGELL